MSKLTLNRNVLARLVYQSAINPDGATFSKVGSYTWVAPFTGNLTVECYGAGGGGGGAGGALFVGSSAGGGGAGGYGKSTTIAVTAGTSYTIVVGAGGTGGTSGSGIAGTDSSFDGGTVAGNGGSGGAVASAVGGIGGIGGGFTGTSGANGGNGDQGLTTSDGKGGSAGGPGGGAGGAAGGALVGPASDGSPYGGGGGGALSSSIVNLAGGKGADGAVVLSWTGTTEFVYVAGCEGPCSTYKVGRWVGTIGGELIYTYIEKCCAYPAADLSGNPLTVGFHEQATYPPGISDYLTVVLSGNNCPVLGANHCVIGEAKWGTVMSWAPSGFGWAGTIAGIIANIWVDASCANPIRFCIVSACNSTTTFSGPADACGSCTGSPCGSPCPYATVTCNFPLRASVGYSNLGACCPGFVTDCTSHGSFTIVGYCRRSGSLGRYIKAQVIPSLSSDKGGPITTPEPGTFTAGPDCPCPPVPFCPPLAPPCCDLNEGCNCPTLTATISNGSGTLTCFNGASGSLACASLVGSVRTWSGTTSFSSCGGITSFAVTVNCDGLTGQWTASLSAGTGCTFSGGTLVAVDCSNRTIHIAGMVGGGPICTGSTLDLTITW